MTEGLPESVTNPTATAYTPASRRFFVREPFCGLSHGLGACLALLGLLILLAHAHGDPWRTASLVLYGLSLTFLYAVSALYHSLWQPEEQLDRWQRVDHLAIFLLLVGTYAPLCLVSLRGPWGLGLGGTVLALATFGIVGSRHGLPDWARVLLYAVIGWLALVAAGPLRHALSPDGFGWLLAGGLLYTLGGLVFAADRPHLWPGRFNAHDLWHLFVLAGSACHYLVMLRYVAPTPH